MLYFHFWAATIGAEEEFGPKRDEVTEEWSKTA
jgi:hypothetical protein